MSKEQVDRALDGFAESMLQAEQSLYEIRKNLEILKRKERVIGDKP